MVYRRHPKSVSVSELGAFASECEEQALLRYRDKVNVRHSTAESRAGEAIHAGVARQARQYESSRRHSQDKRCFVATALYGPEAVETQALRDWRDDVLRKSAAGRLFVCVYYRVSPVLVRCVRQGSVVERGLRALVDAIVRRVI